MLQSISRERIARSPVQITGHRWRNGRSTPSATGWRPSTA